METFYAKKRPELREEFKSQLIPVWTKNGKTDQKMVDFCLAKAEFIVELSGGKLAELDKCNIETNFCFGYSLSRNDSEDYDNAQKCVEYAEKSKEYFKNENLKEIDKLIGYFNGDGSNVLYLLPHYYDQPEDSKLVDFSVRYRYEDKQDIEYPMPEEDRMRILSALKEQRVVFEKRIDTYLKKYGTSKIHAWSYWRDE